METADLLWQVNWEYFTESPTHTGCPYKGEASYHHASINGKTYKDVVWGYKSPLLESALIQGMHCFYPEKVDMWLDGEKKAKEANIVVQAKKEIEGSQQATEDHLTRCGC